MTKAEKEVLWMGSSLKDLRSFPDEVKQVFGTAIYYAQLAACRSIRAEAKTWLFVTRF
jgi:phage-related protein